MIDRVSPQVPGFEPAAPKPAAPRSVLRMIHNERTAGSIPSWETAVTPTQDIEESLSLAQNGGAEENFSDALSSYQRHEPERPAEKPFGFGDILDIVNPLQHIPVVGYLYRKITDDQIRPSGQIIGGGIYGGFLGAAGGIANVIVQHETGRDITGNALRLVTEGELPKLRKYSGDPESQLTDAAKYASPEDLSSALLAFSDLRHDEMRDIDGPAYWREPKRPVWERQ